MIESFKPIIPENPTTLILGTIPGVASLEQQQYYAHPRNSFWKIIAHLYHSEVIPENYEDRKILLISNNIGLWDVLQFCEREGSLDIAIKNPIPNAISELLSQKKSLNQIIFNGKESHKLFVRYFGILENIQYKIVPSTSPANTMKFEQKLKLWREAIS